MKHSTINTFHLALLVIIFLANIKIVDSLNALQQILHVILWGRHVFKEERFRPLTRPWHSSLFSVTVQAVFEMAPPGSSSFFALLIIAKVSHALCCNYCVFEVINRICFDTFEPAVSD